MKERFFTIVFLHALTANAVAQTPENFFPHHLGNVWEYLYESFELRDTLKINVTFDSTDSNGFTYVKTYNRYIGVPPHPGGPWISFYVVDTLYQVFESLRGWNDTIDTREIYRLDAQVGQHWFVRESEIAKIVEIRQDTVFGKPVMVKHFAYYFAGDTSDTTLWLHLYSHELAENFGLIWEGGGDSFHDMFLRAARIDGIVYGDTTVVSVTDEGTRLHPQDYELFQNFPNPFNAQTKIRYSLPVRSYVTIKVFNLLGQQISTLINEIKDPGIHAADIDASQFPSGIYFYRLQTQQQTLTKKMLLLR